MKYMFNIKTAFEIFKPLEKAREELNSREYRLLTDTIAEAVKTVDVRAENGNLKPIISVFEYNVQQEIKRLEESISKAFNLGRYKQHHDLLVSYNKLNSLRKSLLINEMIKPLHKNQLTEEQQMFVGHFISLLDKTENGKNLNSTYKIDVVYPSSRRGIEKLQELLKIDDKYKDYYEFRINNILINVGAPSSYGKGEWLLLNKELQHNKVVEFLLPYLDNYKHIIEI